MAEGDTLVNAVIGAVATAVLSGFVPFAPLFGGGIAGYLEGGTRDDGLRAGVVSGALGLAVTLVFAVLVLTVFGVLAGVPMRMGAFGLFGLLFVGLFGTVYIVGLSAAGGWLGNYVKYDTDLL